jgi:hypothetical protein
MPSKITFVSLLLLLALTSGYTECYKRVGQGDALPRHIKTIAIPAFQNQALRFKVEQRFTSALVDEVLRRQRSLEVVADPAGADAVVNGTVKSFLVRPVLLEQTGRARLFEIILTIGLTVRDQTKNKILYDNQSYVYRGEYEISIDPTQFFVEEGPAVDRVARDFAKSVMTTLLEGF